MGVINDIEGYETIIPLKEYVAAFKVINRFINSIMSDLEFTSIAQNCLNSIPEILGYLGAIYYSVDWNERRLNMLTYSYTGVSEKVFDYLDRSVMDRAIYFNNKHLSETPCVRAALTGEIVMEPNFINTGKTLVTLEEVEKIKHLLCNYMYVSVPVKNKGTVIGVMDFFTPYNGEEELKQLDVDTMIVISNQLGLVLENFRLYKEVKDAYKELKVSNAKLQDQYQLERDMVGIIGHELRTPITVAKGVSELILHRLHQGMQDTEYFKEKTYKVYESIVKESELIQTMLSTTHVDNNKINLQILPVDLVEIIEYSLTVYSKEATNRGLNLSFKNRYNKPFTILSDGNRIQEIIHNLVSNALKYTLKGFVNISLEDTKDCVIVHIEDSGIGIPEKEIKNLGRKFYRVPQYLDGDNEVVRAGGTGLGLYVVKGLVDALGAKLKIQSVVGKGSVFSVYLPKKLSKGLGNTERDRDLIKDMKTN